MKRETNFKDNEHRVFFYYYYLVMEALRITNIKQLDEKIISLGSQSIKNGKELIEYCRGV